MTTVQSDIFHQKFSPVSKWRDANSNDMLSMNDISGKKGTLLILLSNDCAFVHHAFAEILRIVSDYRVLGIGVTGINAAKDSLASMVAFGFENRMDFPYLFDPSAEIASALPATNCPDFFLFDANDQLYYHGRLDDSAPGNGIPSGGYDLRRALDLLLKNEDFPFESKPSVGCKTASVTY